MNKLFAFLTLCGLAAFVVGCGETEKPAAKPPAAPSGSPTPGAPAGAPGAVTPPAGDKDKPAAKDGEDKEGAGAADEKKDEEKKDEEK